MKVGDLVISASARDATLMGIVLKIDESHKMGKYVFPCFVAWNTGETDWMRKEFLEVISEGR